MYDGLSLNTAGLTPYPVGALIFSVVAHTGVIPASNIGAAELHMIFLKPGKQGVVGVGLLAGSGIRKAFIANVLGSDLDLPDGLPDGGSCPVPTGSTFSFTGCTEESTADLLNFVDRTPNAIGYAEVPQPGYPQVSVLSIDGSAPTPHNVLNGSYKFWTAEHLYAASRPATLTKDFLDFLPRYLESNPQHGFIACSAVLKKLKSAC